MQGRKLTCFPKFTISLEWRQSWSNRLKTIPKWSSNFQNKTKLLALQNLSSMQSGDIYGELASSHRSKRTESITIFQTTIHNGSKQWIDGDSIWSKVALRWQKWLLLAWDCKETLSPKWWREVRIYLLQQAVILKNTNNRLCLLVFTTVIMH